MNAFHSLDYLRHNARRLEHLASLRLPLAGLSVLEVGAGIGDHSHYYLDRGCRLTITDAREENLCLLRTRYPTADLRKLDLDAPRLTPDGSFDVIHGYGVLYHLKDPLGALEFLARHCGRLLLVETCVSFGQGEALNPVAEDRLDPTQAVGGCGCRPTRSWVFARLRERFAHVYVPQTQPNHEEFPLDWSAPERHPTRLSRAIFIASRQPLHNDVLLTTLPEQQCRHD